MKKGAGMAIALLYNLKDEKKLAALRFALIKHGVRARSVLPEEYTHPVGYLCALAGFAGAEDAAQGSFDDEMLVLGGLSSAQLDGVLNTLRARHVSIALKAAVTEENAQWSSLRLHEELRQEHAAMRGK